ncbi:hypothetical protein AB0F03_31520, partial [Streptomyces sp. NPDC028722]|uniref:hypothetical protein n=1 Tax=Streptomyces sp. NPDC028722 TaxID=3155016 RepID=UPI003411D402
MWRVSGHADGPGYGATAEGVKPGPAGVRPVTLGTFLMLTGMNLGFTKLIDGTVSTKTIGD